MAYKKLKKQLLWSLVLSGFIAFSVSLICVTSVYAAAQSQKTTFKNPKKRSRKKKHAVREHVSRLLRFSPCQLFKRVRPHCLSSFKDWCRYSIAYPLASKYYAVREDGLQRTDYFSLLRIALYLYLTKQSIHYWSYLSTLTCLLGAGVGKYAIDWVETQTDPERENRQSAQQNYVNKMLSFLTDEQRQQIVTDKDLFGCIIVAQEYNDPRLLKENQRFVSFLTEQQHEYLDTLVLEYMSHHELFMPSVRSSLDSSAEDRLTRSKLYDDAKGDVSSLWIRSSLPWADAIEAEISYTYVDPQ